MTNRNRYGWVVVWSSALLAALAWGSSNADAAPQRRQRGADQANKPVAPPAPKSALLTVEDWQKAPIKPLQAGEIDKLLAKDLQRDNIQPAPLTTDEQFIRRVTLDLTGELPMPADVKDFLADRNPNKRAKLIDKLLASDEYARHWARYWKDVIGTRATDPRAQFTARPFEEWLTEQFKNNHKWDQIARAMITAEGAARYDEPEKNGAVYFLASHRGADAANERAAETARVFLGIQIQCAQCHDHPFDQWKRVQFHELAAYYSRLGEQLVRDGQRAVGWRLTSRPFGEHEMPSKEDPKKTLLTHPRFLDGKSPGNNLADQERRKALADAIVNTNNYWFAAAYVNRIWGQLTGQAFYMPIDDMGPKKEVVFPEILTRLTGSFRASHYDIKVLFRDIMNSQAYQRQIRLSESADQHLHFASAYPTRLSANALWQSLVNVLGNMGGPPARRPPGPFGAAFTLEGFFKQEFGFDASLKADEVEGSVTQALLMMNNPQINQRVQAKGTNLLARILSAYPHDNDALQMVYLRTLARKPTDREVEKCRAYIAKIGNRTEAFEDILWSLLNSTEFQTKR
jgi:hypothetical protein